MRLSRRPAERHAEHWRYRLERRRYAEAVRAFKDSECTDPDCTDRDCDGQRHPETIE